ncbi:acyl-CoA dehydrogenase family protein [Desulfobulbus sp. AH-315-M07]|nr:acyl-CoA dehydrogenase family protein [Desulfobulbus sp. AH-315-M07]
MITFDLSEDQKLMQTSVAQFAKAVLAERVREFEKLRELPEDVRATASELFLGTVALPEEAGGQGLGLLTAVLLEEELGKADVGAAFALPGPGAFGVALCELGTAEQQEEFLSPFAQPDANAYGAVAWSELPNKERAGFSTVAKKDGDGWILNGTKSFVTHAGIANSYLVFAQIDEQAGWDGIAAFVVAADNPGLSIGERYTTLGLDAVRFGEVVLKDAKVSDKARLLGGDDFTTATLRFFSKQALIVAGRAVGLAQFAFDVAREYCDNRKAFGKPIGHFQAVAFNLADRLMDVESSRWLVWKAAWSWDAGKDERTCLGLTAAAAAHTFEAVMRCTDDCVSLHGGSGFIRDLIAEKLMRDAKQLALCCATAGQLDQLAARVELGASLDAALLLPTPDTQPIFT